MVRPKEYLNIIINNGQPVMGVNDFVTKMTHLRPDDKAKN